MLIDVFSDLFVECFEKWAFWVCAADGVSVIDCLSYVWRKDGCFYLLISFWYVLFVCLFNNVCEKGGGFVYVGWWWMI